MVSYTLAIFCYLPRFVFNKTGLMKTDILITDICLAAPKGTGILPHCYIAIQDDTISAIGPLSELESTRAKTVVDGQGQLALPGLINAHCHGAMTLFRGLADDLELTQWLQEYIFPAEAAHVHPEMVYWCTRLAAAEMIMSGTTTVADGYFLEHDAARAFADTGIRAVAAQGVIDFPAPGVPDPEHNIAAAADFIDHWHRNNPLITPAVFAHSPYTCSPETLQRAKQLASDKGVQLFIHVAESRAEAGMITNMEGGSPIRHLDKLNILDENTVCIHCVWADDNDLEIIAQRKSKIVVCPQSHLKLSSGIAPLRSMLEKGITAGLGTDGAASNNGLDMFREMDICAKVQKINYADPVAVPASKILAMASPQGAAVLNLQDITGALLPGYKADIILLDIAKPHLQPMHGTDLLVYSAGGADVQSVLINGKLVMQERKILSFNLTETLQQVNLLAANLT